MNLLSDAESIQSHHGIVGRLAELEAILACLHAGRHVLVEGPVGVGKTVIVQAVALSLGRPFHRVDGDGRYSEARLVGAWDAPTVMELGYVPEAFQPGPLVRAMREGAILFVNELNRMPEGVQNVLLPTMDEGRLLVPQLGKVEATQGFAVVATQNPREFVATADLSEAILDRFELVKLDFQPEEQEQAIVARRCTCDPSPAIVAAAVALVRATRHDPRIRRGASIRAAIAIADLAATLDGDVARAATLALPTRIELVDDRELPRLLDDLQKKVLGEAPPSPLST